MEDWSLDTINSYCEEHLGGSIACKVVEGQGRIMIAQKKIAQGELLFIEPPLHIVKEEENNQAFKVVQQLYEQDDDEDFDYEPLWYWTALSSLTKEQLKNGPKVGSLQPVTAEQQRRLLCLYHDPVEEASDAVKLILKKIGLKVAPILVEELLQAWVLNCFDHSDDPPGYSAYFASSFANHSCGPNAIWYETDDGSHALRAREHIDIGDEITISYLDEDALLHSADSRKRVLKDTKLFDCTCRRCAPPVTETENLGADVCRGFICKYCNECAVFHPLKRVGKGSGKGKGKTKGKDALQGILCSSCGAVVDGNEGRRLLHAEADLEIKLKTLDEQVEEKGLGKVMNQDRARSLLKLVANGESGPVGPQHWLCDRLWVHLQEWYGLCDRRAEQRQMMQFRIDYQRKAYSGSSAALAWTLEQHADLLMRHIGFGSKVLDTDRQFLDGLAAQVEPMFQESLSILGHMFGKEHEYYTQVDKKHKLSQRFFELEKALHEVGNPKPKPKPKPQPKPKPKPEAAPKPKPEPKPTPDLWSCLAGCCFNLPCTWVPCTCGSLRFSISLTNA